MQELEDQALHAEVHEGNGHYALLVHGILSSRAQWILNLEALSEVCRPVVVELLGHGRSSSPDEPHPYTPSGYVEAFERIREAIEADSWFVVGQSLGAALTLGYALDHPDRVVAQVFTNSASALADEKWQERTHRGSSMMAQRIKDGGLEALDALPIHPSKARRMPNEVKKQLLEDAKLLDPAAVAMAFLHTVPGSSVRSRSSEIKVPTLLAYGVKEESFAESARYARETIPQLEVVELDAGHAVNIGDADAFNRSVCEFFSRNQSR